MLVLPLEVITFRAFNSVIYAEIVEIGFTIKPGFHYPS